MARWPESEPFMKTTMPHLRDSDDLARSLRHLVHEADDYLKSAADSGDEKLEAVREQLARQVSRMRSQLEDLEAGAMHQARRAARKTDRMVHAHPYGAMGIAAAAGLLIGFLAARR